MTLSDRQRREQREQLRRARRSLDERQIPAVDRERDGPLHSESDWHDLVERRIQEAMADGAFDNLSGEGKPLDLNRNPYLDPSLDLAYGLLKNNGYVPEWIARDKEIRQGLETARGRLHAAWEQHRANLIDEMAWQAALARFVESLVQLNRKIDDFNLIVPVSSCQRVRLRLADEVRRLQPASGSAED